MLGWSVSTRILLFTGAVDMRKGFDGLTAIVAAAGEDVYSGCFYVFLSGRRDRAKILLFQKGGLELWCKRLDRGRFKVNLPEGGARVELDATQLAMLLDGIDFARVRRPRHWEPHRSKTVRKGIDNWERL
jgi:transposase